MTAKEIWKILDDGQLDYEFFCDDKHGSICFCNSPDVHVIYDDGDDVITTAEELMNLKFIDGKSLNEVNDKIEFYGLTR